MIFSFQPMKKQIQIGKMANKFLLSETISFKGIQKKLRLQTEPATENNSLGVTMHFSPGKNSNQ